MILSLNQVQTNICRAARACGLPTVQAREFTDYCMRQIRNRGPQAFIDREKEYKMWYLTYLSGNPEVPEWCKTSPKGIPPRRSPYNGIFRMKNIHRALALMSMGSLLVLKNGEFSAKQVSKSLSGFGLDKSVKVNRNDLPHIDHLLDTKHKDIRKDIPKSAKGWESAYLLGNFRQTMRQVNPEYGTPCGELTHYGDAAKSVSSDLWFGKGRLKKQRVPSSVYSRIEDLVNPDTLTQVYPEYYQKTLPELDRTTGKSRRVHSINDARQYLAEDLEYNFPSSTAHFLDGIGRMDLIPDKYWCGLLGYSDLDEESLNQYNGRLILVQEEFFKPRLAGTPNRILQFYQEPLAEVFYLLADEPTNVMENQASGAEWAMRKLHDGVELASSDMTSASDLLDRRKVLYAIIQEFQLDLHMSKDGFRNLMFHMEHFEQSASNWKLDPSIFDSSLPKEKFAVNVSYQKGWCLGTRASFNFLTLANTLAATTACRMAGVQTSDAFRILGDDIVMISTIEPYYKDIIKSWGGEINDTKSIISNRVAEFAGYVITGDFYAPKSLKFKDSTYVTDIFRFVDALGPSAVGLLNRKQRKLYNRFKYVPGVSRSGPWSHHSGGEPLRKRVEWSETVLPSSKTEPDKYTTTIRESVQKMDFQTGKTDIGLHPVSECKSDEVGIEEESIQPQKKESIFSKFRSVFKGFEPFSGDDLENVFNYSDYTVSTGRSSESRQTPVIDLPSIDTEIRTYPSGDPRMRIPGPDSYLKHIEDQKAQDKLSKKEDPLGEGTENRYQHLRRPFTPYSKFFEKEERDMIRVLNDLVNKEPLYVQSSVETTLTFWVKQGWSPLRILDQYEALRHFVDKAISDNILLPDTLQPVYDWPILDAKQLNDILSKALIQKAKDDISETDIHIDIDDPCKGPYGK